MTIGGNTTNSFAIYCNERETPEIAREYRKLTTRVYFYVTGNNQRQLQLHPQPQIQSNPSHHDFQVTQSQNMSIGSNTQDRSTHLTRGSNHIARKLSPPRKSSADRSARKDDEDRRKRDERDRERRDRERFDLS